MTKPATKVFSLRVTPEDRELIQRAAELAEGSKVDGVRAALRMFVKSNGDGPGSDRELQGLVKAAVLEALSEVRRRPLRKEKPSE